VFEGTDEHGSDHHAAELEQNKMTSIPSNPNLAVNHRPVVVEPDHQENECQ
jgi:hypothetical protein